MDGGGFFSYPNGSTLVAMVGSLTGCASACRLAKSARMASERLTRWAAEGSSAEGSGGRRRKGGGRRGNSARRLAGRQGEQCKEVEKMWLG